MYHIQESNYPMKPRERLSLLGAEKLSDQELLAILLRTGSKKQDVLALSAQLLQHFGSLESFRQSTINELKQINGIGQVKAIELKAMMELGKRIQTTERKRYGQVVGSKELGMSLTDEMQDFDQEHLVAIYLDGQNKIIQKKTIFVGTVNQSTANPREILYYAIKFLAASLIVVHNHPSGSCVPSTADRLFTKRIKQVCEDVGVNFIDHLVIGREKYFSFREMKMLEEG